ncbi:MAG: OmpH family outer membrane protein [Flavobacteriales bacterium]|nr:OmpH family outer membrane protein [Flavobacteriales bacterium]
MNSKLFGEVVLVFAIAGILIGTMAWINQPKIGYIRSQELVYGYIGMKEAHNKFNEKAQNWEANIKNLQEDYQKELALYNQDFLGMSDVEKQERGSKMQAMQNNFVQYSEAIDKKAKEEDDKITEGVLNQINSFVEDYGDRNNYDVILGTSAAGSLMYGKEGIDITNEILDELNMNYQGGE